MDTNWLADFLVLSKRGNFSQAADERNITQSAFSRRIKALETWLGTELFDRSSYPVSLTPEGEIFHASAQNVLRELELNRVEFQRRNSAATPDIRLAASTSLALSFVPEWLHQIKQGCGAFSVSIDSYDFYEMVELLGDRKMDLLVLYFKPEVPAFFEHQEFDSIKLGDDTMHLCTALDANGRPAFDVDKPPSTGLEYIGYGQTGYFSKVEDLLFSSMTAQDPAFVCASQSGTCEFMKRLAHLDQKMLWLPACSAYEDVQAGRLALAGNGRYDTNLEIWVFKKRDAPSPLVQKIWSHLKSNPCTSHLENYRLS
ncbi:LysR family transcriptional regulator [uncultured Roseibium sp.]|uniref:LysR family transcriptional regulator n=1 Tax=uncultured Roseibium sp. TaxID=1936171 RepID=UPI002639F2AE|nr:LysR family transcriptional regulator [uncultured Roseibium sp.]